MRVWVKRALMAAGAVAVGIQLVPYGRDHTNPPVTSEPPWSDPAVRTLAVRACFDCHSNETKWPWYSQIAPASWVLQRDVDVGRRHLNFSEWDRPQADAKEAPEEVAEGEMPMGLYALVHREGALSPRERQALVTGLRETLGAEPYEAGDRRRGALERWLVQADAELRFGILQTVMRGW